MAQPTEDITLGEFLIFSSITKQSYRLDWSGDNWYRNNSDEICVQKIKFNPDSDRCIIYQDEDGLLSIFVKGQTVKLDGYWLGTTQGYDAVGQYIRRIDDPDEAKEYVVALPNALSKVAVYPNPPYACYRPDLVNTNPMTAYTSLDYEGTEGASSNRLWKNEINYDRADAVTVGESIPENTTPLYVTNWRYLESKYANYYAQPSITATDENARMIENHELNDAYWVKEQFEHSADKQTADWSIIRSNAITNGARELPDAYKFINKPRALAYVVGGVYVTDDLEQAIDYIENGNIGDHLLNNPLPKGEDNPNEDGDGGRYGDDMGQSEPDFSTQQFNGVNTYFCTPQQIKEFTDWFNKDNNDIFTVLANWVTGKWNNLANAILTIYDYPVPASYIGVDNDTENKDIILATLNSNITATAIYQKAPLVTLGEIDIGTSHGGSYIDYAPYTDIYLYLPFYGWTKLDTNLYMGTKLVVKAMFDCLSNKVTYYLWSHGDTKILTDTLDAKVGTEVAITLENSVERMTQVMNNVISTASSMATMKMNGANATATAMIGAQGLGMQATPQLSVAGGSTEQSGQYQPNRLTLMIKSPSYNVPSNYGQVIGYPTFKQKKLKDIQGFVVCDNAYIEWDNDCVLYEDERNEVINLLNEGVYL